MHFNKISWMMTFFRSKVIKFIHKQYSQAQRNKPNIFCDGSTRMR